MRDLSKGLVRRLSPQAKGQCSMWPLSQIRCGNEKFILKLKIPQHLPPFLGKIGTQIIVNVTLDSRHFFSRSRMSRLCERSLRRPDQRILCPQIVPHGSTVEGGTVHCRYAGSLPVTLSNSLPNLVKWPWKAYQGSLRVPL